MASIDACQQQFLLRCVGWFRLPCSQCLLPCTADGADAREHPHRRGVQGRPHHPRLGAHERAPLRRRAYRRLGAGEFTVTTLLPPPSIHDPSTTNQLARAPRRIIQHQSCSTLACTLIKSNQMKTENPKTWPAAINAGSWLSTDRRSPTSHMIHRPRPFIRRPPWI